MKWLRIGNLDFVVVVYVVHDAQDIPLTANQLNVMIGSKQGPKPLVPIKKFFQIDVRVPFGQ